MNTHYRHFRETDFQKNHTFCGVVSTKGHLLIGLAICNPIDQFVKATDKETAFAHAHTKPIAELVIPEGEYSGHVFHEFINNMFPVATFKTRISLGEVVLV